MGKRHVDVYVGGGFSLTSWLDRNEGFGSVGQIMNIKSELAKLRDTMGVPEIHIWSKENG